MNINPALRTGLLIAGGAVAVGGLALLAGCTQQNQDKTSEAVAGDFIRRYDKNNDGKLNAEFETTRSVPQSQCVSWVDTNNDGVGDSCAWFDSYNDNYSIAALANRADKTLGNGDGVATQDEIAKVVREFDTGDPEGKGKATAGDNIMQKPEIKSFNRSYEEAYTGRTG